MEKKMFLFVLAMGLVLSGCSTVCGPLESPISKDDIDKVRALLESGVDVDARGGPECAALHATAMSAPKPQMAKLLIEEGADVNIRDRYGRTPLIWACYFGAGETVDVNRWQVVTLLLDAGADPDIVDVNGMTALMYATENCYVEIVELLIENGANVNIKVGKRTALKIAKGWLFQNRYYPQSRKVVELLEKAGAVE